MKRTDLKLTGIIDNDYKSVVLGRKSHHALDPNFKVEREEILDIIAEAAIASPNAVGSQPWCFLICDTPESMQKLDDIMRIYDKDRVNKCSFAVVPLADRNWFDSYDELLEVQAKEVPARYTPDIVPLFAKVVYDWYDELTDIDKLTGVKGAYLERSINFQAGLVTMNFINACRSHGLDSGVMDSWDPDLVGEAFGVDLKRYVPQVAIAVGKAMAEEPDSYRYTPDKLVIWGE